MHTIRTGDAFPLGTLAVHPSVVVIQSARRTHVEVHFHVPDLHLQLLQHVRVLQVEVLNGLQAGHVHVQASQISEHAQRGCVAQAELEVTAAGTHTKTDEGGERVLQRTQSAATQWTWTLT